MITSSNLWTDWAKIAPFKIRVLLSVRGVVLEDILNIKVITSLNFRMELANFYSVFPNYRCIVLVFGILSWIATLLTDA